MFQLFLLAFAFSSAQSSLINTCTSPSAMYPFEAKKLSGLWYTQAYLGPKQEEIGVCNRVMFSTTDSTIREIIKFVKIENLSDVKIFDNTYNTDSNGSGEIRNTVKNVTRPWWFKYLGIKEKPVSSRFIATDYTNYVISHYCNEDKALINQDELFILTRTANFDEKLMQTVENKLKGLGYETNGLRLVDQKSKSCDIISFD